MLIIKVSSTFFLTYGERAGGAPKSSRWSPPTVCRGADTLELNMIKTLTALGARYTEKSEEKGYAEIRLG